MIERVLISGGGIAGPALACFLADHGVAVTVVEIADGVRPGGQAVDVRGAGRRVLESLGLLDRARELSLDQEGIADVDSNGRHLSEMSVEVFGGDGIISETEILRGEMAQMLVDASLARGVEYVFSTRIDELFERSDGVRVLLSDGSAREVDVVVGADGPHSATRRIVFGPEERFVRPIGGYVAWFTAPGMEGLDGWYQMYNEPGGLVATMRPGRDPGVAKASLSFTAEPLEYDRHDQGQQRQLVAQRFARAGWRSSQLVEAARNADDFYFDALVQVHMERWTKGRVALVGDAGYCPSPLTGLGTSLALVGAYVLAGELTTCDDHVQAFARYEEGIREYVATGQKLPPGGIRSYAPQTRRAISLRVLTTRLMVSRPFRGLARKLLFSKADSIELPTYVTTDREHP